jgi:hypothetical protein
MKMNSGGTKSDFSGPSRKEVLPFCPDVDLVDALVEDLVEALDDALV